MALASVLLKHYAVAKLSSTPWSQLLAANNPDGAFTRDARTKPVYIDPATGTQPVSFNVSHQAGIVAIIAVAGYQPPPSSTSEAEKAQAQAAVEVGVDVVCSSERRARDHGMIARDGWPAFVDMHADVFAPGEVAYLKHRVLSSSAAAGLVVPAASAPTTEQLVDVKLRAFYALWALREAYVKLTGEALLAEWLRELEFVDFRPPRPTAGWEVPAREGGVEGDGEGEGEDAEVIRRIDIRFRGDRVEDVNMCLRSMGQDYMIATAVRTPRRKEDGLGWGLGPYEILSLEEVLDFAESSR
jgi:4'-phosphopantetheinyl transferase